MAAKQMHISDYIQRKEAQQRASYYNGKIIYKGEKYTYDEFDEMFGTKHVSQVTSRNFPPTAKNPDKTKID